WDMGQKYARDADRPVWHKSIHFRRSEEIFPRQSGTVGTEVRGGREPAGSAEIEDFHLGHPTHFCQNYAWDVKN
ncbi:hypothetical protein KI387_043470, partial [Taxus chinensis]